MKYNTLNNFQHIFEREDYAHICNKNHIEQISSIFLNSLSNPDGKESLYKTIAIKYLENLTSFLTWLQTKDIPDLAEAYKILSEEIKRAINLLGESEVKRRSISSGYCKKFNKIFLYELTILNKGIEFSFDPEIISSTNINREQIIRYLFDNKVGLGRKYLYNKIGKHSFVNKVPLLNRLELIFSLKLLTRPSHNDVRTFNKWRDLGSGQAPVRLLVAEKLLGKDKIYFLFRINEHPAYQAQLLVHPEKVAFAA